ncbi:MAG: ROK family protein [Clostridiales bacterium]|nr:ROK family protein [Clostridiales bacterium]
MLVGAFDVGGTKTIIALANSDGTVLLKKQFPTNTRDCLEHLEYCCDVFLQLLAENGSSVGQVEGIGVNLPGLVDKKQGILIKAVYAGWNNVPVGSFLQKKLNVPHIFCENDVNSCAIGELCFGLGRKYASFGWMTVSTGVGGALVCNRKLIRGAHGNAGEIGHLKVEYDQPRSCPCGGKGCLEAHGSGTALNRLIEERIRSDAVFRAAFDSGVKPDGASCAALAKAGNPVACEIFECLGRYLGRGIAHYVNLLDPEAVIIGGGVSASLDFLMPGILAALASDVFSPMRNVKILPTALGYEAALMGAIALATWEENDK